MEKKTLKMEKIVEEMVRGTIQKTWWKPKHTMSMQISGLVVMILAGWAEGSRLDSRLGAQELSK